MPPSQRFKLPSDISPTGTVTWCIDLPDDDEWLRLMVGALTDLCFWGNYERNPEKSASIVARRWREILATLRNTVEVTDYLLQFNPVTEALEQSYDGGDTWEEVVDLTPFQEDVRVVDDVLEKTVDGGDTWEEVVDLSIYEGGVGPAGPKGDKGDTGEQGPPGAGGQPGEQEGGDEPITDGTCKDYTFTVFGNGLTLVPFRVVPGDTVEVVSSEGAWTNDGTTISSWYCASGGPFLLGQCGNESAAPDGDFITDKSVGRLIARYGSVYLDIMAGPVEIPAGDEYQLELLMNDSDRTDNAGSVTVALQVCNPPPDLWCYEFDFSTLDGWTVLIGSLGTGELVGSYGANGYRHDLDQATSAYSTMIRIKRTISTPINGLQAEIHWHNHWDNGDDTAVGFRFKFGDYNGVAGPFGEGDRVDTLLTIEHGTDTTGDMELIIAFGYSGGYSSPVPVVTLGTLVLRGEGENPFGTDNCT